MLCSGALRDGKINRLDDRDLVPIISESTLEEVIFFCELAEIRSFHTLPSLRIEGSGNGHLTGWSWSKGSVGCSTGLNSIATSIPCAAAIVVAATSGFGGNGLLSSC